MDPNPKNRTWWDVAVYNYHFPRNLDEEDYSYPYMRDNYEPIHWESHYPSESDKQYLLELEARKKARYEKETDDVRKEYKKLEEAYEEAQKKIHALEQLLLIERAYRYVTPDGTLPLELLKDYGQDLELLLTYTKPRGRTVKRYFNEYFLRVIMNSLPDKSIIAYGPNSVYRKNMYKLDGNNFYHNCYYFARVSIDADTGEKSFIASYEDIVQTNDGTLISLRDGAWNAHQTTDDAIKELKNRVMYLKGNKNVFKSHYGGCSSFVIALYDKEKTPDDAEKWYNWVYKPLYGYDGRDREYYDDILFEGGK